MSESHEPTLLPPDELSHVDQQADAARAQARLRELEESDAAKPDRVLRSTRDDEEVIDQQQAVNEIGAAKARETLRRISQSERENQI